jgi:hypothetical protein
MGFVFSRRSVGGRYHGMLRRLALHHLHTAVRSSRHYSLLFAADLQHRMAAESGGISGWIRFHSAAGLSGDGHFRFGVAS